MIKNVCKYYVYRARVLIVWLVIDEYRENSSWDGWIKIEIKASKIFDKMTCWDEQKWTNDDDDEIVENVEWRVST